MLSYWRRASLTRREDAALAQISDIRSAPTSEFIESVRARFPTEAEIDRVLTRKMKARAGPGYSPLSLDQVVEGVRSLIASEHGGDFTISNPRWLQGGASKIQIAFELDWTGPDGGERRTDSLALRMQPPESIVETSRRREFEVIKAMDGVIPVPPCFWIDADGSHLPYPSILYGFVEGVSRPSKAPVTKVSGVGTNFGPELRPVLARQFVEALTRIHKPGEAQLAQMPSFASAEIGSTSAMLRQLNWWRRVWEEDRPCDLPLVDVAYRWLVENAVPLDHVSVVHGDFRAGNFLYSEESQKITAWLDWELAVLGDRHQDLCWATGGHFGHYSEDGTTFLACGLLPAEEMFELYEKLSGLTVDPVRLKYFRVLNDFMSTVHMLASAWRVARLGKTHQDVTVAWLSMIGNGIAGHLAATLEEVI